MQAFPDAHAGAKFWLDVADKAIKALAVVVGAGWTYLNYRRGRTFERRLELEVTGELFERSGGHYLSMICRLKNVGLTAVPLQERGTACMVFALTGTEMRPDEPVDIYEVFKEHAWIEPGELITHQELVPLPFFSRELVGIELQMRVVSPGIEWNARCVVKVADVSEEVSLPVRPAEVHS
ncbi:hypothetical protein Terro_0565 [Terriglobus roseus DSM 18391]|uniref:Uncharacterized protein n=1 Tax=Terriglobus roseus (strain DSM 18391 / NRRL B-41598 / KBS 63) TaxID=926566 RepID=I3ZCD7_TERRK|nr:hypothetical protein [Terriglobus roseus]AFL86905.1 hypothetical protein Terro_0565 [Terriglobus roseus DSM 18391]